MAKSSSDLERAEEILDFRNKTQKLAAEQLIGYEYLIDDFLTTFLCNGHTLLVGLPGLGKTLLIKTLSAIWGLDFSRIQFTPDLLPADITGTEILQEKPGKSGKMERIFEFQKGPVFANLILADEINRTPPKTQSALLQAMEEKEITVGHRTMPMPDPFMVMATQNPIEMEGTYNLPEAQLDRFFMSLKIEYPEYKNELIIAMLSDQQKDKLQKIKPIADPKKIIEWRKLVDRVPLPESILVKIVNSVRRTRPNSDLMIAKRYIEYGAGPRATQFL